MGRYYPDCCIMVRVNRDTNSTLITSQLALQNCRESEKSDCFVFDTLQYIDGPQANTDSRTLLWTTIHAPFLGISLIGQSLSELHTSLNGASAHGALTHFGSNLHGTAAASNGMLAGHEDDLRRCLQANNAQFLVVLVIMISIQG